MTVGLESPPIRTTRPRKLPAILTRGYWSAKRTALLVGFVLTIVGTLGTPLIVEPVEAVSSGLELSAKDIAARMDTLKTAQLQFILFQQQGALIFAQSAAGLATTAPNGGQIVSQLYQLDMLDRSSAIQTIIGSLAIDGRLDYRGTFDRYKALVDAARKTLSLATYTAVDDMETGISHQGTEEIGRLQAVLAGVAAQKSEADAQADRRKLILLMAMTLGSACLLAANLIATREPAGSKPAVDVGAPEAGAATDDRVTELSTAAYLIEVALERARTMGERKGN